MRAQAHRQHRHAAEIDDQHAPRPHLARRRWAALIQRVWQIDPLACPRCRSPMRILSFIQPPQHDVIEKILTHCGLWKESSPAPPHDHHRPAQQQGLDQLRFVSDLQFLDAAPPEQVWTPP